MPPISFAQLSRQQLRHRQQETKSPADIWADLPAARPFRSRTSAIIGLVSLASAGLFLLAALWPR